MRKLLGLLAIWFMFCGGIALGQSLLLLGSGGGAGTPSSGFTPCSGTTFHLTAPNDFTNAAWNKSNITAANAVLDPQGNTTASSALATTSAASVNQTIGNGNLTLNTTYAFTAYFKDITTGTWILFRVADGIGNIFGNWFNLDTKAAGNTNVAGAGSTTCAKATTAGNGWTQVSLAGNFSANVTSAVLVLLPCDSGTTCSPAVNTTIGGWQISP